MFKAIAPISKGSKCHRQGKARTFVDVEDEAAKIRFSRNRTPYWFVTINPKPEVDIELLHNTIVHVLSQEQISEPYWSYEIRDAPDQGLHAHLLFKCNVLDDNFCKRKIKARLYPKYVVHLNMSILNG